MAKDSSDPDAGRPDGGVTALPARLVQSEVDALRVAWQDDPLDFGIGLYNPATGEIHVRSMDSLQGAGHHGLAVELTISDRTEWRGFVVVSTGAAENVSHFNLVDRADSGHTLRMRDEYFQQVRAALRAAGLIA